MQNSNECSFDRELRTTVEKYSNDGLLSAGEIIAVLEVVKHSTVHAAENAAADTEVDNFTSTNTGMLSASQIAAIVRLLDAECKYENDVITYHRVVEILRQLQHT